MTGVIIIVILMQAVVLRLTFTAGFRRGCRHWKSELARVRLEAAQSERRLHELTRQAFESMAETVERHRSNRS